MPISLVGGIGYGEDIGLQRMNGTNYSNCVNAKGGIMGWIMLIGLVGIIFFLFGFGVVEPAKRKALKEAYALLQEKHPDPKAMKKAMRAFPYQTEETRELTRRLMAKLL